ncbi:hypothetical protein [Prevotella sp. E2-28]|uniref:hypothetical protein n=1 Tax=Prevotella sp. E2-28 TaxID=2913620 RepID=UPI001EDBAAEC|nr:hypothetical protein [Prevotella sp. E2-28]UKK54823.1 hypothetical protein L6465_06090 [Prevotella sp. E2-28]
MGATVLLIFYTSHIIHQTSDIKHLKTLIAINWSINFSLIIFLLRKKSFEEIFIKNLYEEILSGLLAAGYAPLLRASHEPEAHLSVISCVPSVASVTLRDAERRAFCVRSHQTSAISHQTSHPSTNLAPGAG